MEHHQSEQEKSTDLPPTEQLLILGGDHRLAINPSTGFNKYGCQATPNPEFLAFGSSTASVISEFGFSCANQLRLRLLTELQFKSPTYIYAKEMQRIRDEWLNFYRLSDSDPTDLIFARSGTDAHHIAAQLFINSTNTIPRIIMVESSETGSGVLAAVSQIDLIPGTVETIQIRIRHNNGAPRSVSETDQQVEFLIREATSSNRAVLLIITDQSKTSLIAPSISCATAMHQQFPNQVVILIDACQFRIQSSTITAYLQQGFMVTTSGSKFLGGPSFSGMLLIPSALAKHFQRYPIPSTLSAHSFRGEWPINWTNKDTLSNNTNFGLLLRCQVAIDEFRRFIQVPEVLVVKFLIDFDNAIQQRMNNDPHFQPLVSLPFDRRPLVPFSPEYHWDQLPSVFPFLLHHPGYDDQSTPLDQVQTQQIYQQLPMALIEKPQPLASLRCQLGQPVNIAMFAGSGLSALRLCVSAQHLIEAAFNHSIAKCIEDALKVLDKTAMLIDRLDR